MIYDEDTEISSEGSEADLDKQDTMYEKQKEEEFYERERTCTTTVEGLLQYINLTSNPKIAVHSPVFPKIICHFQDALFEEIKSGLGKKVAVTGQGTYRKFEDYPYTIDINEIKILEHENLKDFDVSKFRGCMPEITGDLTVDQYIKNIRNEWE